MNFRKIFLSTFVIVLVSVLAFFAFIKWPNSVPSKSDSNPSDREILVHSFRHYKSDDNNLTAVSKKLGIPMKVVFVERETYNSVRVLNKPDVIIFSSLSDLGILKGDEEFSFVDHSRVPYSLDEKVRIGHDVFPLTLRGRIIYAKKDLSSYQGNLLKVRSMLDLSNADIDSLCISNLRRSYNVTLLSSIYTAFSEKGENPLEATEKWLRELIEKTSGFSVSGGDKSQILSKSCDYSIANHYYGFKKIEGAKNLRIIDTKDIIAGAYLASKGESSGQHVVKGNPEARVFYDSSSIALLSDKKSAQDFFYAMLEPDNLYSFSQGAFDIPSFVFSQEFRNDAKSMFKKSYKCPVQNGFLYPIKEDCSYALSMEKKYNSLPLVKVVENVSTAVEILERIES